MIFFDIGHGIFDALTVFTVDCKDQFVACLFIIFYRFQNSDMIIFQILKNIVSTTVEYSCNIFICFDRTRNVTSIYEAVSYFVQNKKNQMNVQYQMII